MDGYELGTHGCLIIGSAYQRCKMKSEFGIFEKKILLEKFVFGFCLLLSIVMISGAPQGLESAGSPCDPTPSYF